MAAWAFCREIYAQMRLVCVPAVTQSESRGVITLNGRTNVHHQFISIGSSRGRGFEPHLVCTASSSVWQSVEHGLLFVLARI